MFNLKIIKFWSYLIAGIGLLFIQGFVFADGGGDLTQISTNVTSELKSVANVIVMVSYVAGIAFALIGIMQFKAHKDNPQQIPLSKAMVSVIVGACLLFLPTVIQSTGASIFGSGAKAGQQTSIISDTK